MRFDPAEHIDRIAGECFTEENYDDPATVRWTAEPPLVDGQYVFVPARCSESGFGYERVMFVMVDAERPTSIACLVHEGSGWSLLSTVGPQGSWRESPTALDLLGPERAAGGGCAAALLLLGAALGCLI